MQSIGWLLIFVGLGWWGWQKYSPAVVSWFKPAGPSPLVNAVDAKQEAFDAVRVLVAYYSATGQKAGLAAAKVCGSLLFEEPDHE